MDTRLHGLDLGSIQDLNALPSPLRDGLYTRLIPDEALTHLAVDRATGTNVAGHRVLRVVAPPDASWARVDVRAAPDDRDPVVMVDVEMSPFAVPELAFVQIADPAAPRFAIDRGETGQDTLFGTVARNVPEERRALLAGLAPGQVRRGLRLLGPVLGAMEDFCRLLGKEIFLVEPLFYHSALLYERHGFAYLLGQDLMERIHDGFQPDGPLHLALDGSTPFRPVGFDRTVRGRSWAIHDGVLAALDGLAWGGVKMYRLAGRRAGVSTFPGGAY